MTPVEKTIGLLDHLGNGNLGDDASMDAVMQNIRYRWPNARIIGLTFNPYDTEQRHGIPTYPIHRHTTKVPPWLLPPTPTTHSPSSLKARLKRHLSKWKMVFSVLRILRAIKSVTIELSANFVRETVFLTKSLQVVRSLDMLVMCGGGQLIDWGGPWSFPYTLFKWTLLAKLSGVPCYYINLGAGPLRDWLSQLFVRLALLLTDYSSFRDEASKALVYKLGFRRPSDVFPDVVYSYEIPISDVRRMAQDDQPLIGLSPMAYRDPRVSFWDKEQAAFDRYIHHLGLFACSLARGGHRLRLFSTELSLDALAIEDIRRALTNAGDIGAGSFVHDSVPDIETLFAQISAMDYIITSRFHGVVFAHLMNKPVLAISPHPKVATLMSDLGLAQYCVDTRTFEADVLLEAFGQLVRNQDCIRAQMTRTAASYKTRLARQFDSLFQGCGITHDGRSVGVITREPTPTC